MLADAGARPGIAGEVFFAGASGKSGAVISMNEAAGVGTTGAAATGSALGGVAADAACV